MLQSLKMLLRKGASFFTITIRLRLFHMFTSSVYQAFNISNTVYLASCHNSLHFKSLIVDKDLLQSCKYHFLDRLS